MARIEDHALIGDCRSAALVTRDGTVDWLCWPRFDSPACFAALLGTNDHGAWRVAPADPAIRVTRRYLGDTMVLETVFETATGSVAVIDLMAIGQPALVRIVEGRAGAVPMRLDLTLRFEYGAIRPWITRLHDGHGIRAVTGPNQVVLRADVPVAAIGSVAEARFSATPGQRVRFVLAHGESHGPPVTPPDADDALRDTLAWWDAWSARGTYRGAWGDPVRRSLLTLKALCHRETGGIIAAPTTSLPERIGGARNWDYRYCWLRDASLTLIAAMRAGHVAEARAWAGWLRRTVAGSADRMRPLYGLGGERLAMEWEVPWLPGHAGSRPVRVGNAAADQVQLDVYGEVLAALSRAIETDLIDPLETWPLVTELLLHLATIWHEPDEGIWEIRGPRRHFTVSKVMAWVAFDRAVAAAEARNLPCDLAGWRATRDQIHTMVCERGYHKGSQCFTQSFGDTELDASLLLLPAFGFLPADDPRMRRTIEAIGRDLAVDGLIARYRAASGMDGLPPGEGVFLACSFWYVDALAALGRWAEARTLFDRLLVLRNDVGLLAEEYDPATGRQLGNFPQGLSHVALVNAAMTLDGAPDR